MRPLKHRTVIAIGVLLLAGVVLAGCGDEGDTDVPGVSSTATTLRERDRDRDRIQQAVDDIVAACQDQDRDRLRDRFGDQDRDRLRDGTCDAIADGAKVSVVSTEVIVEGDEATVAVQLRVRTNDGNAYELGDTWRFRWTADGWVLSEVPATIDSSETSPTTLQEQARERDQDCETPSTLQDQEQDQDCDTPTTLRDQDQTQGT